MLVLSVQRVELVRLIAYITATFLGTGVDCRRYLNLLHVRWELKLKLSSWFGRATTTNLVEGYS